MTERGLGFAAKNAVTKWKSRMTSAVSGLRIRVGFAKVARQLTSGSIKRDAILGPGSTVAFSFSSRNPPGENAFQAEVTAALQKSLTDNDVTIAANTTVKVQVIVTEKSTGKQTTYRSFGGGGSTTVSVREAEILVKITDNGQAVWQNSSKLQNTSFVARPPNGVTLQDYLNKELWKKVSSNLRSYRFPKYVFKKSAEGGAGTSTLGANGVSG